MQVRNQGNGRQPKRYPPFNICLHLICCLWLLALSANAADESDEPDAEYKPIVSSEAMLLGHQSASTKCRLAQRYLMLGNYDLAIKFVKQSLQENNDDEETHLIYAQSLEKKLRSQGQSDNELFNECVKQWLICLRQEVGYEKLSVPGIGLSIPKLGEFYQDEDTSMPAKQHLKELTGRLPKAWETDAHYLKKVTQPSTVEVTGTLLNQHKK